MKYGGTIIIRYLLMTRRNKIDLTDDTESRMTKQRDNSINYWTGTEYSSRYYQILETRSKLPAFEAKEPLVNLL